VCIFFTLSTSVGETKLNINSVFILHAIYRHISNDFLCITLKLSLHRKSVAFHNDLQVVFAISCNLIMCKLYCDTEPNNIVVYMCKWSFCVYRNSEIWWTLSFGR